MLLHSGYLVYLHYAARVSTENFKMERIYLSTYYIKSALTL
jgi:hypothetical protein